MYIALITYIAHLDSNTLVSYNLPITIPNSGLEVQHRIPSKSPDLCIKALGLPNFNQRTSNNKYPASNPLSDISSYLFTTHHPIATSKFSIWYTTNGLALSVLLPVKAASSSVYNSISSDSIFKSRTQRRHFQTKNSHQNFYQFYFRKTSPKSRIVKEFHLSVFCRTL